MKKPFKKTLSIILSVMMLLSLSAVAFASDADYTIVSPYADVIWEGENAWGAYKGSLHSHTTYSDADVDLATMIFLLMPTTVLQVRNGTSIRPSFPFMLIRPF